MIKAKKVVGVFGLLTTIAAGGVAHASNFALDTASNYQTGTFDTGNTGYGFGAWNVVTALNGGGYVGSYVQNNDYLGNYSWTLYADQPSTAYAYRAFTGGALGVGQLLTVTGEQLRSQAIGGNGGFQLTDSNRNVLLKVYAVGGTNSYFVDDSNGNQQTVSNSGYNYRSAVNFAFVLNDNLGDYTLTLTGASNTSFSGKIDPTNGISQFAFFDLHGGGDSDVYLEGLSITPEPSCMGLIGVGVFGLLRRRARRN